MVSYAQFIVDYDEFSNPVTYPQSRFNLYAQIATLMLTPRWGEPAAPGQPYTMYDIGFELIIAHNLTLRGMDAQAVAAGGAPGLSRGVISGEAAGDVNVSYDTVSATEPDAGQWNLTRYGIQFVEYARLIGAAPTQVSPPAPCFPNSGPAWIGPPPWPGWFSS